MRGPTWVVSDKVALTFRRSITQTTYDLVDYFILCLCGSMQHALDDTMDG
jgi:hypothetical protein